MPAVEWPPLDGARVISTLVAVRKWRRQGSELGVFERQEVV